MSVEPESPPSSSSERRHDLDALRAIAMLLGIALHLAISFIPGAAVGWAVQDNEPHAGFSVFLDLIHGFRMPLFFLISGYFTAMLWRKRGLRSLVAHRSKRILFPLVIGMFTIIPVVWIVSIYVSGAVKQTAAASIEDTVVESLWIAIADDDAAAIRKLSASGLDCADQRNEAGVTTLTVAASLGRPSACRALLDCNADPNIASADGNYPIHAAAFYGRDQVLGILLIAGAEPDVKNGVGQTAMDILHTDLGTTRWFAGATGIDFEDAELLAGRLNSAEMLGASANQVEMLTAEQDPSAAAVKGLIQLVMYFPFFHHLWFLWFLCWLVFGFSVVAFAVDMLCGRSAGGDAHSIVPQWLVLSPIAYLWLIPLTCVPQWFMVQNPDAFGPDTSIGLVPIPAVLLYYAIFFGFGAMCFESRVASDAIGKYWFVTIPLSLLAIFPAGLAINAGVLDGAFSERQIRMIGTVTQVSYAWFVSFGLMGLFRRFFSHENHVMRYLSDSSYWLYLVHIPVVVYAQYLVHDLAIPGVAKFAVLCVGVSIVLLASYHLCVRYTPIGTLLNGPRKKLQHVDTADVAIEK